MWKLKFAEEFHCFQKKSQKDVSFNEQVMSVNACHLARSLLIKTSVIFHCGLRMRKRSLTRQNFHLVNFCSSLSFKLDFELIGYLLSFQKRKHLTQRDEKRVISFSSSLHINMMNVC